MSEMVIEVYGVLFFIAALAVSCCIVVWFVMRTICHAFELLMQRAHQKWLKRNYLL